MARSSSSAPSQKFSGDGSDPSAVGQWRVYLHESPEFSDAERKKLGYDLIDYLVSEIITTDDYFQVEISQSAGGNINHLALKIRLGILNIIEELGLRSAGAFNTSPHSDTEIFISNDLSIAFSLSLSESGVFLFFNRKSYIAEIMGAYFERIEDLLLNNNSRYGNVHLADISQSLRLAKQLLRSLGRPELDVAKLLNVFGSEFEQLRPDREVPFPGGGEDLSEKMHDETAKSLMKIFGCSAQIAERVSQHVERLVAVAPTELYADISSGEDALAFFQRVWKSKPTAFYIEDIELFDPQLIFAIRDRVSNLNRKLEPEARLSVAQILPKSRPVGPELGTRREANRRAQAGYRARNPAAK